MTTCLTTNEIAADTQVKPADKRHLPGDLAMWFFILMELTVFAIFFIGFAVAERLNPELFTSGRQSLHVWVGLVCTLSLVISSYFVALAVVKVRENNNPVAKKLLLSALLFACVYLGVKLWEYRQLIELGYDLSTNTFYTLYFFTTAFHFMHVLLGMIILAYMAVRTGKNVYSQQNCQGFEAGASYWHMVDLVWILLFFLVYVVH